MIDVNGVMFFLFLLLFCTNNAIFFMYDQNHQEPFW